MHRCPVLLESPVNTCSKARLWTTGCASAMENVPILLGNLLKVITVATEQENSLWLH